MTWNRYVKTYSFHVNGMHGYHAAINSKFSSWYDKLKTAALTSGAEYKYKENTNW